MEKNIVLKRYVLFSLIIVFFLAVAVMLGYIANEYGIGVPCALNEIFGIYCSGCGLTRAAGAIFRLDFYQAFRYNAFSLVLLPVLFIMIVLVVWESIFNKNSIICGYGKTASRKG